MIEAITFDLWWTILIDTPEFDETRKKIRMKGFHRILGSQGLDTSLEDLHNAYDRSRKVLEDIWFTNEEIAPSDQIKVILDLAGSVIWEEFDDDVLSELEMEYGSAILRDLPQLDEEIVGILQACKDKNLKVGLICNVGRSSGRYLTKTLEELGIVSYFDSLIFSNEIGVRKPDPRIFRIALGKLGTTPDHTVHVGDELMSDVLGAKNVGIRAIWVNRSKEQIQEGIPKPDYEIDDLTGLIEILDRM
ncbi:MAG: HAD family hydrolase [Candidatus Thorarchaeota archaeon]|jgi:putative hydrolase of the HAD superfamily